MNLLQTFLCASLLVCSFSCYAQNSSSEITEQDAFLFEGDTMAFTYANLSHLLEMEKIEDAVRMITEKSSLATFLTVKEVEGIGWEKWVEIGANTFATLNSSSIPKGEPWKTMDEENANWALTTDKSIVIEMLSERIETAKEKAETAKEKAETAKEKADNAIVNDIQDKLKKLKANEHRLSLKRKQMMKDELIKQADGIQDEELKVRIIAALQKLSF